MNYQTPNSCNERLTAWIVDDRSEGRKELARSFEAVGVATEEEGSITKIGKRVRRLAQPGSEPPEIIVIDQHWEIMISDLSILGRADIAIELPQSVGHGLGVFFRSCDELDDSLLLMTSVHEDEVRVVPLDLGQAIAVPKSKILALPDLVSQGLTKGEALQSIGIDAAAIGAVRRTLKLLEHTANSLGLARDSMSALAGARAGTAATSTELRDFLWTSRDAHDRARELLDIITFLRQGFGSNMKDLELVQSRLNLKAPIRESLLVGTLGDLILLRCALEAKAGGALA